MKKILFITAFPPSTIGAGVNYTRQLLEDLSNYFEIDLVIFSNGKEKDYKPVQSNIRIKYIFKISQLHKILNVFFFPIIFPLFSAKFSFRYYYKIKKLIEKNTYSYVYYDFSQMFLYNKFLGNVSEKCKSILMAHDIIAQRYLRKNKIIGNWAKKSERWILKGDNSIFTFSLKDSGLLKSWYNYSAISTSFYFSEDVKKSYPSKIGDYYVFFAMWKRPDNHKGLEWFLTNVLPKLTDFKAKIIGTGLPPNILDLIKENSNFEYLGFVQNPYPIIANSKALISPLFQGAGVKVKVLDALAVGAPIIGTNISFEGIDNCYGPLMIPANNIEQFCRAIYMNKVSIDARIKYKKLFLRNNGTKKIIEFLLQN